MAEKIAQEPFFETEITVSSENDYLKNHLSLWKMIRVISKEFFSLMRPDWSSIVLGVEAIRV